MSTNNLNTGGRFKLELLQDCAGTLRSVDALKSRLDYSAASTSKNARHCRLPSGRIYRGRQQRRHFSTIKKLWLLLKGRPPLYTVRCRKTLAIRKKLCWPA